jgi:KDO2-lipid IV(A) lauroyltransferase
MNETLRKLLEYKRANQPVIIGYISDQKPLWVNIHHWVDFLNHDTPVLTGAERIVKKFGHAAFYGEMRRVRRGYYEMEMKLITREPQALPDYELTDAYYRLLEESIRREPGLWLWSHKRWARTREEFNRRFEVVDGKVIEKKSLETKA